MRNPSRNSWHGRLFAYSYKLNGKSPPERFDAWTYCAQVAFMLFAIPLWGMVWILANSFFVPSCGVYYPWHMNLPGSALAGPFNYRIRGKEFPAGLIHLPLWTIALCIFGVVEEGVFITLFYIVGFLATLALLGLVLAGILLFEKMRQRCPQMVLQ